VRYTVTVEGDVFEIEIGPGGCAWVNQRPYDVDLWHVDGNGEYSLLVNNRSYEVHVAGNGGGVSNVMIGRRSYRARLQRGHWVVGVGVADATPPDARGSWLDRRLSPIVEMRAPLPGLLLKVLVREGEYVEEQALVVILESMKMNLELRAPRSGVVHEILASPGDQVAQDQILAIIEPPLASHSETNT
jgi:acetyl/propionyl-CoA carboxylase alpha subunit